ncbi:hypothetical protein [Mycobacterium intracellulare]|uniref:hypothetical protein n=1 Tax=Mycobacterium intracellulare TaxID=1767 RepID=UPI00094F91BF|nr:hypothetical protein [Mycobacterium intracellulare]
MIVQLTFDGFEVSEIKEISDTGLESMDFVIETDRDSWLDMVDNIRAGDGRPDLDHTLNALSMASTPIRVCHLILWQGHVFPLQPEFAAFHQQERSAVSRR